MKADALAVLSLMLGFLSMVGVGVWANLRDETREEIAQFKGPLLAGAGAVAAALVALVAV